ncbi:MAG: 3-keto-disaccharide hydrolase [Longimicrobiales bacterium]
MHSNRIGFATASLLVIAVASCAPGTGDVDDARAGTEQTGRAAGEQSAAANQPANALTPEQAQEGWRLLFDGTSTGGWRGYNRSDMPAGWQAVDGALTRTAEAGDIITTEQFANFELALDWMLRPGGNSGIFYRAVESDDPIYYSAPEMQVLDDAVHVDGGSPLTSAGANYGLHPAPQGVVRPVGDWNSVRLIVNGNHVEHWLNGQKIVEYELGSDDWKQRVANSKFVEWPAYGTAARGHIGLQDHGDWVAFRNIRIRVLP